MSETKPPRHIGRSIGALFAGFLVGAGLSLGTDEILHVAAVPAMLRAKPTMPPTKACHIGRSGASRAMT